MWRLVYRDRLRWLSFGSIGSLRVGSRNFRHVDANMNVSEPFANDERHPAGPRTDSLEHRSAINPALGDDERVDVPNAAVFSVGPSGVENLRQQLRPAVRFVTQCILTLFDGHPADHVRERPNLGGRDASVAMKRFDDGHDESGFEGCFQPAEQAAEATRF